MAAATDQSLLQPLIHRPAGGDNATSDSDSGILLRLLSVILIGAVSLWANREAAKGFDITIVNNVNNSPVGRKFDLFYRSDDKACRILLSTSSFVERLLYDRVPLHHRKLVSRVTVRLSGENSTVRIPVTSGASHGDYVISLSSSLMEDRDYDRIITSTLRRAMVRIWLWGDEAGAPLQVMAGMAEYIAAMAVGEEDSSQLLDRGGSQDCWKDHDPESVAKFLAYCDGLSEGFIGRLNQRMRRHRWDDRTVDMAFGNRTAESACDEMARRIKA
ncbi:PREDICTED: uncharacterized protein LOC104802278 [Tarenaya hassleriana]|uniref:uncharacterized protein LOC104802278 n=1 Tax=Tarenaya hassleriana TaxID=28532 RepID=UPI00053C5C5A|nr:PREDICTED: uncharacterized protein LOC104802278 [Tarenaya hassleriana]